MTKKDHIKQKLRKGKFSTRTLAALTSSSLSYVGSVLAEIRRGGSLKHELTDDGYPKRYWMEG